MTCCVQNTFNFVNQAVTSVAFPNPVSVEVLYKVDGVWIQAGVFTQITKSPTGVVVDHGGLATGIIKIT
jgi:hypothetical protein